MSQEQQTQQVPDQTPQPQKFVDGDIVEDNWFQSGDDQNEEEFEGLPNDGEPNQEDPAAADPNAVSEPQQQVPPTQQPVTTEADKAMQQVQEYQKFDPFIELYKNDPGFQAHVQGYVNQPYQPLPPNPYGLPQQPNPYQQPQMYPGMQTQQIPQNIPQQPVGVPPQQMPKPPEGFEPYDMFNPATPSGQYFQQVMQTQNQQMAGQIAQQMQTQYQQEIEQLRLEQIQRQAEQSQYIQFRATHPEMNEQEAQAFWQWSGNPNNITIDSLYELYQVVHKQNQQPNEVKTQAPNQPVNPVEETLNKIRQNQTYPQTSVNVNDGKENETDEQQFLKGFGDHLLTY